MPLKTRLLKSSLQNKGFKAELGNHIFLCFETTNGNETNIWTKISHGKSEYDDNLLALVAKQLKLSKKQLLDLVNCPLSREDYEDILKQKGYV